MFVTSGSYATRANGDRSERDELLIFNPAGTEHDDHLQTGGAFFTVTIQDRTFLKETPPLPMTPTIFNVSKGFSGIRRLLRELSSWSADSEAVADSLAADLIAAVQGPISLRGPPRWLDRARDLLDECYREPLYLTGVAAALDVHPVHLTRCFRLHFGTTPGEYLRSRRLREAASLLTHTSMSLAELALEIGFADQAHLTRRFSAEYGISPGAYRRRTQA